ncbi:MAG: cytochrome oxidase subunit III [Bacteroidetes bacterium]|nr:cytochrome oxidase subunit III [Bacteroidota bacterium]
MDAEPLYKPTLSQVPKGRLAIWILVAGELVIFGGLIMSYLLSRVRFPEWADQAAHTSTMWGAINTIVLLTSSFFAVKAHEAALKKNLQKVTLFMSSTIACGFLFLIVKTIEYTNEIHHGFTLPGTHVAETDPIGSTFWAYYFLMTGLHGLHVIVGMTILFVVLLKARKGQYLHRVENAGIYWHMVDLVWIFLFPLLYIAK